MCGPLKVASAAHSLVDGAHAWTDDDIAMLDFTRVQVDGVGTEAGPYLHVDFPGGRTRHRLYPWRRGDLPVIKDGVWMWVRPRPVAQLIEPEELP